MSVYLFVFLSLVRHVSDQPFVPHHHHHHHHHPVRRVPPHFSVPPESVEVMPSGSVNLTCVAIGSPMPEVRWRIGTLPLTPDEPAPLGKNVLMLHDVTESATYTCLASSELGSIEYDAEVKVKGKVKDHDTTSYISYNKSRFSGYFFIRTPEA